MVSVFAEKESCRRNRARELAQTIQIGRQIIQDLKSKLVAKKYPSTQSDMAPCFEVLPRNRKSLLVAHIVELPCTS
jgi:hypothetical protein